MKKILFLDMPMFYSQKIDSIESTTEPVESKDFYCSHGNKVTSAVKKHSGFSLIELIAVIVIIAVVVGGVAMTINTGDPAQRFNEQVEKFVAFSEYASEMATITGESIALFLEPPAWREDDGREGDYGWQYSWKISSIKGWQDLEAMPNNEFDPAVNLLVLLNEEEWEYENAPEIIEPILEFSPSGDITPFQIEITHEDLLDEIAHIEIDVWGEITWRESAEAMEELKEYLQDN